MRYFQKNAADDRIASRVNQYAKTRGDQDSSCESHKFNCSCSSICYEHFTKEEVIDHIFKQREMVKEERDVHHVFTQLKRQQEDIYEKREKRTNYI